MIITIPWNVYPHFLWFTYETTEDQKLSVLCPQSHDYSAMYPDDIPPQAVLILQYVVLIILFEGW